MLYLSPQSFASSRETNGTPLTAYLGQSCSAAIATTYDANLSRDALGAFTLRR
jgi:hypothetical protein